MQREVWCTLVQRGCILNELVPDKGLAKAPQTWLLDVQPREWLCLVLLGLEECRIISDN